MKKQEAPGAFLEPYRGRLFRGQRPTIPQMLEITCERLVAVTA